MGHEIVYCSRCLTRLTSADFDAGRARRLGNQVACASCAEELLSEMSPPERDKALLAESTTKSRVIKESTRRAHVSSPSGRAVRIDPRHAMQEAPRSGPVVPIVLGVIAAVVGVGIVFLVVSDGDAPPEPVPAPIARPVDPAPPPPPVPAADPARLAEAKKLLEQARGIPSGDLARKIAAYDAALAKAGLSPLFGTVKEERDALVRKFELGFPAALSELDAKARPIRKAEEFVKAEAVYREVRDRHGLDSWRGLVDGKIREVRRNADMLFPLVREKAGAARSTGETGEVEALRARVRKWGYADLLSSLDAHLEGIKAPTPPSAALMAYGAAWEGVVTLAARRDFEGALAKLGEVINSAEAEDLKEEAQRDKRLVERLHGLHREIRTLLSRWPAGRSLLLHYFDREGEMMEIEGPVIGSGPDRIEYADEKGSFFIEFDDVTSYGLATAYRARDRRLTDWNARGLAVGCLLEGDEEGAKDLLKGTGKDLPEKYWAYAKTARKRLPRPSARELEARALFHAAEVEFRKPGTTAEAAVKYARLAAEFADTRIVSRALDLVLERKEAGKEYLLFPDALAAKGTFARMEHEKIGPCWLSGQMATDSAVNYVEFEFSALPETPYKCWVLAGGCCAETFEVHYQATELTARNPDNRNRRESAEPGAALAPELKHRIRYLKRTHDAHGGPKEPARWEWMAVALPEFASAGPKKVRLYNGQKGFGVAAVVISSLRKTPPKKDELEALRDKARKEREPVAKGLLGWWRFDELNGTRAGDATGNGYDGTFEGSPGAWEEGKLGGALTLGDAFIKVGHDDALNAYPVSISAWIRTTNSDGAVLNKYLASSRNGYQLYVTGGVLRAWYFKDDQNYIWDRASGMNGGKVDDGVWHHVAFVVDDAGGRLYLDGELKEERKWTGRPGPTKTKQALSLGRYPSGSKAPILFRGTLDDVRLYERALSEDEVLLLASGDPVEARAAAEAASADAAAGWEPLFDGKTLDFMVSNSRTAWKVDDGAVVHVDGVDNAAQSSGSYTDGEVRVRFEVTEEAQYFHFNVRQGAEGSAGIRLEDDDLGALAGASHELIIVFRGDEVDASLDGRPAVIQGNKSARSGRIQFNVRGTGVRITGLDYRP